MSNHLNKQLIGARIPAFDWDPTECFDLWRQHTQLGRFIIDNDLHPQLFEILGNMLGKVLNGDLLGQFLYKTETAHSSQPPKMLLIIARTLPTLEESSARAFLNWVMNKPDISTDRVKFIERCAKSFLTNTDLLTETLERMIDVARLNPRAAQLGLVSMGDDYSLCGQVVSTLISHLSDLSLSGFLCGVFDGIIKAPDLMPIDFFDSVFTIVDMATRPRVVGALGAIAAKQRRSPSPA
jgi:hypothetical protein